jgi:predicted amidohydrolase YtcJ
MKRAVLQLAVAGGLVLVTGAVGDGGQVPAVLVVEGGPILLLDTADTTVEAVAFAGGTLVAAGPRAEVERRAGSTARRLDLRGRTLLPSFKDHHVHLLNLGLALLNHEEGGHRQLDLTGRSLSAVAEAVAARCRRLAPGTWVLGQGWSQGDAPLPGAEPLTRACPENPVLLARSDGHAGWANALALAHGGFGASDPAAGRVLRRPGGTPAGVLLERANEPLLAQVPPLSDADVAAAFQRAARSLAERGVTEVYDAGVLSPPGLVDLGAPFERYRELLRRADAETPLPVRVNLMIPAPSGAAERALAGECRLSPRIRVTHLKLFADGALGSRGAALSHPYADDAGTTGVPRMTSAEIERWATRALDAGLDVATHAIGDAAVAATLDAYERILARRPDVAPRRLRIEHFSYAAPAGMERAARLGVLLVVQPGFIWPDASGRTMEETRVGPERAARLYTFGSLARRGAVLAGSTDEFAAPEPIFRHVHAAATRRSPAGDPPGGWHPEERLSRLGSLRLFTDFYPAGGGRPTGALTPGVEADWIVVSADPRRVPDEDLLRLRVHRTVRGGQVVFDDGTLGDAAPKEPRRRADEPGARRIAGAAHVLTSAGATAILGPVTSPPGTHRSRAEVRCTQRYSCPSTTRRTPTGP